MIMNKKIAIILGSVLLLFLYLLFFVDKKSDEAQQNSIVRAENASSITFEELEIYSLSPLSSEQKQAYQALKDSVDRLLIDEQKVALFKEISGWWYKQGDIAMSACYAEKVGEIETTDEPWSIAGVNYTNALTRYKDERFKTFLFEKAEFAFKNAKLKNPTNLDHEKNLASLYINHSPQPMQGIMQVRDLIKANPQDISLHLMLAELSFYRTKDYPKAITRLLEALKVDSENLQANYLLAESYRQNGDTSSAKPYYKKCLDLSDNATFKREISDIINNF